MNPILIIAEASVNNIESIELAKQLIDAAKATMVDIVNFQTFEIENLITKLAKKAEYQLANTKNYGSQFSMLKKLELNYEDN